MGIGVFDVEAADIFPGAFGHAEPADMRCSSNLCTHNLFFFSKEQKDGVCFSVCIKAIGVDQVLDDGKGDAAIDVEI